jgi:hypothetical protein
VIRNHHDSQPNRRRTDYAFIRYLPTQYITHRYTMNHQHQYTPLKCFQAAPMKRNLNVEISANFHLLNIYVYNNFLYIYIYIYIFFFFYMMSNPSNLLRVPTHISKSRTYTTLKELPVTMIRRLRRISCCMNLHDPSSYM